MSGSTQFSIISTESNSPDFLKKIFGNLKGKNTYASEKAKGFIPVENVISGGNVTTIIPKKDQRYLITAGGWDNEREVYADSFSKEYPGSEFHAMTTEEEGNMIWKSITPFLVSLAINPPISIICSGKTTIHFFIVRVNRSIGTVSPVFVKKLSVNATQEIVDTVKSMKTGIFFLGGLFSVAGKKTHPSLNDTSYIQCTKQHYMSKIHPKSGDDFLHIKENLGEMMNEVLLNLDDSVEIIVGGR